MKTIALVTALLLHITGLWSHVSTHAKSEIIAGTRVVQPASVITSDQLTLFPVQTNPAHLNLESGSSVYAFDRATGLPLYSQAASQKRPMASITKLTTAMVILSRHKPDEIVTIGQLPTYTSEDDTIGLQAGEKYRLGDLITAALVPSANDAADALAIYDAGSTTKFIAEMNAKVKQWNIPDTHFNSASGLEDDNNYTTALALSRIATLALANPLIAHTVQQSSATITGLGGRSFTMATTDELLATGEFYGIKTGYTTDAGQCFVGLTKINGHDVITVVLGSSDRFGETQALVNWIGSNWTWL